MNYIKKRNYKNPNKFASCEAKNPTKLAEVILLPTRLYINEKKVIFV